MNPYEAYMKEMAKPMREELTSQNFVDLDSSEKVENYMSNLTNNETTFVVINSVCGCAAGIARPAAVTVATQNPNKPDNTITVFAGQDKEATMKMREYIDKVPSSPSMALFKGTELVYFMPREQIEGRDIEDVMMDLKEQFDHHCA